MSVSENISCMRRWYQEVWNESKDETIFELLDADAVVHGHAGPEGVIRGPQEFQQFVHQIRRAFPDTKLIIEDIFGDGDKVVTRWVATGTHTGEGFGPSSGKTIRVTGTSIVQFANGKAIAGWDNWDRMGMMEQIGAFGAGELAKTA